jgi:hypothetical protein
VRIDDANPTPNIGDTFSIPILGGGTATMLNGYLDIVFSHNQLFNTRYIMKPAGVSDPNPIYQDSFWKIYENPVALPHAWVVHNIRYQASDKDVLEDLSGHPGELRRAAFMSTYIGKSLELPSGGDEGDVRITSYEPNRISAQVHTSASGLVVMSEMFYPGWRATVNGKESRIYKVDYLLRGIVVPAGESKVGLFFSPLILWAGFSITVLTFVATVLTVFLSLRFERKASRSAQLDVDSPSYLSNSGI